MWNRLDFILPETLCIEKDYGDIFIRNMLVLMQCIEPRSPKIKAQHIMRFSSGQKYNLLYKFGFNFITRHVWFELFFGAGKRGL